MKKEPVILFVSHKFPPSTGGMEKQSFELVTGMEKYTKVHSITYEGSESILFFFLRLNKRIKHTLKLHPEINIIHFNDGLIASMTLFHKGYTHIPQVVTVHGLDVVFPLRYFQKKILPKFNRFSKIIAVSQATEQAILDRGIRKEKTVVICNGIDHDWAVEDQKLDFKSLLEQYQVPKNKKYLIMLGRPVKRKGFSWFIRNILPKLNKDFHLLLIGPYQKKRSSRETFLQILPSHIQHLISLFLGFPSDQNELRKILNNPTNNSITHLGKLPANELRCILRNADTFLMPNIGVDGDMEGFGLVCLEASICGAVVLASAREGITDAIHHNKNGILIPSEDIEAWVQGCNALADFPQDYQQLRDHAKSYTISNFSWDKMVSEYYKLFSEITSNCKMTS